MRKIILVLIITLIHFTSYSQCFNSLPDTINISNDDIEMFFSNDHISINIDNNISIYNLPVIKYSDKSVGVKLHDYDNAVVSFSRKYDINGDSYFTGRIIQKSSIDCYELVKINNQYFFEKILVSQIRPICDTLLDNTIILPESGTTGDIKLNSLPRSKFTIFLDFDGANINSAIWNGGVPFYCEPSFLTNNQILEIFYRVSEDYRIFDINITTDSTVFENTDQNKRQRVVITSTSEWYGAVGGVAYQSFGGIRGFEYDEPCFVFSSLLGATKSIAECCSHESGHTLGLAHQSLYDTSCVLTSVYHAGYGSGEIGWAPIMGVGYYRNMTTWTFGTLPYACNRYQDDINIILTNGFSLRQDDYSNDIASSGLLNLLTTTNGLITPNDIDFFKFTLSNKSIVQMLFIPFNIDSIVNNPKNNAANLDIKVKLYDTSNNLLSIYNDSDILSVSIDTLLNKGDYYISVEGTNNIYNKNISSGEYNIISNIIITLPINNVILKYQNNSLVWNTIEDCTYIVQISNDGITFNDALSTIINSYYINNYGYYRIKVLNKNGDIKYSNIEYVSNRINNISIINSIDNIIINSNLNFKYRILSVDGKVLNRGIGSKGYNVINFKLKGIYYLNIISNKSEIFKIIK